MRENLAPPFDYKGQNIQVSEQNRTDHILLVYHMKMTKAMFKL